MVSDVSLHHYIKVEVVAVNDAPELTLQAAPVNYTVRRCRLTSC